MNSNNSVNKELKLQLHELQLKYDTLKSAYDRQNEAKTFTISESGYPVAGQKNAELKFRESKDNLQAIFNAIDESIYLVSADGILLLLNEMAAGQLGGPSEQLTGRNIFDLLPPHIAASVRPFIDRVLSARGHVSLTDVRNGRWMWSRIYPILDGHGQVTRMVIFSRDITNQKDSEDSLRKSEARYRLLSENITDLIWVQDLEDNSFKYISPSCERVLGYSVAELMSYGIENTLTPASNKYLKSVIPGRIERFRTGIRESFVDEAEHILKDGSTAWMEISSHIILNPQNGRMEATGVARNITSWKKAELEKEKAYNQLNVLLRTSMDGIHIIDDHGNIIDANPAFCRLLGYTSDELMQLRICDLDVQWPEAELLLKIRELIAHPEVFETKHRRKDGAISEIQVSAAGFAIEGKNFLYASARDITESNRAKEQVRQTRHNFETFFNTVDDFLWVLDLQGNIIFTNIRVIDRLGYSKEELSGKSVLMVHPPEQREEAGRIVGDMLNGKAEYCPVPIMTKAGIMIPVETRVSHGSWDGNPVIFGVSKDISKIKLSEEKFSKVFYLNPSACGLSDLSNSTYIEVNDAFCAFFGFEKDEVIGKTASELHILSEETKRAILLMADNKGNVTGAHAELRAKNGDIKQVLLSSENIQVQDKTYRFTVVHDITERKKAENAIRELNLSLEQRVKERTNELETINKKLAFHLGEIEQLTYIAAHDLSEPLVTLTNFTQLIHEEYAGNLDDDGNKSIDFIYHSAARMKTLVKGILDYSRLGKDSKLTKVDCNEIAGEVLSYMQDSVKESNAKINIQLLPVVNGYKTELILLFQNLINNAIKFRKKKICPEINISAEFLKNEWQFDVKDNGIGISEQDRKKVFVIFKRMVNRDEFEGTGIGLAHCKKIVELHGGEIWVDSNNDGGSTFSFTIPVLSEN